MSKFVYDKALGRMVDKATGEPMNDPGQDWSPACPQVFGDTPGYRSPIDGSWIEGRRARRYDMEKNNCVDANEVNAPRKLRNERFVSKHGLQHLTEQ